MEPRRDSEARQLGEAANLTGSRSGKATGGPRSRIVEAIAVLLLARPMRAAEIAQALGYPTRYVSSYLSYWRTRGLFDYEAGFWTLTPQGEEYARAIVEREMNSRVAQYAALARKIVAEQNTATMNDERTAPRAPVSGGSLPFTAGDIVRRGKKRQEARSPAACIRAVLSDPGLTEDERTVLETLLNHYTRWGSTYTYLDHLERELDADRAWLLSVARLLQAKKLIYIYTDRRLGVRIGLSKNLRELLAQCR